MGAEGMHGEGKESRLHGALDQACFDVVLLREIVDETGCPSHEAELARIVVLTGD